MILLLLLSSLYFFLGSSESVPSQSGLGTGCFNASSFAAVIGFQQMNVEEKLSYFQVAGIHGQPLVPWDENTKPVTDGLRAWFHEHLDHPYPSEEDKQMFMTRTGLTISQVRLCPLWALVQAECVVGVRRY